MNNNMEIYELVREVPKTAQKQIGGGRLKGMTDINPMWRIKKLTEVFGPVGFNWYYEVIDKWTEQVAGTTEIAAMVQIKLYVKKGNEWSQGIVGIGGSMLSTNERNGLYVNDECFKMALTDAISVACKSLGVGADIYWGADNTKYNDVKRNPAPQKAAPKKEQKPVEYITGEQAEEIATLIDWSGADVDSFLKYFKISDIFKMQKSDYEPAVQMLNKKIERLAQQEAELPEAMRG